MIETVSTKPQLRVEQGRNYVFLLQPDASSLLSREIELKISI